MRNSLGEQETVVISLQTKVKDTTFTFWFADAWLCWIARCPRMLKTIFELLAKRAVIFSSYIINFCSCATDFVYETLKFQT